MTDTRLETLLTGATELLGCATLAELVVEAAGFARGILPADEVCVVIHAPDGQSVASEGHAQGALQGWVTTLLSNAQRLHTAHEGPFLAYGIGSEEDGVRGLLALSSASSASEEELRLAGVLAQLLTSCARGLVERSRTGRTLSDVQKSLGQGLHDLRTPLSSLRLGLHLLEPALAAQDPSVVQRMHRAVDRMALLVSEMAEALGNPASPKQPVAAVPSVAMGPGPRAVGDEPRERMDGRSSSRA